MILICLFNVGKQTHGLKLLTEDNNVTYLYLNNWEPLQTPLGLIPNIKIHVKRVRKQNSYLKACDVTSFEVIPEDSCDLSEIDYDEFLNAFPEEIASNKIGESSEVDDEIRNENPEAIRSDTATLNCNNAIIKEFEIKVFCEKCKMLIAEGVDCKKCLESENFIQFQAT